MAQPESPDPLLPQMPRAMLMNPWPLKLGFGNDTNNHAGYGSPSTLSLTDPEGALLASIAMPPRGSFGICAAVTDALGKPVAWLRSPEPHRQLSLQHLRRKASGAQAAAGRGRHPGYDRLSLGDPDPPPSD